MPTSLGTLPAGVVSRGVTGELVKFEANITAARYPRMAALAELQSARQHTRELESLGCGN